MFFKYHTIVLQPPVAVKIIPSSDEMSINLKIHFQEGNILEQKMINFLK